MVDVILLQIISLFLGTMVVLIVIIPHLQRQVSFIELLILNLMGIVAWGFAAVIKAIKDKK